MAVKVKRIKKIFKYLLVNLSVYHLIKIMFIKIKKKLLSCFNILYDVIIIIIIIGVLSCPPPH